MASRSNSQQKKLTQASLEQALLNSGPLSAPLFEKILTDYVDEMEASLQEDTDDALICLVSEGQDVALMLFEWDGTLHQNEAARERLQQMWKHNYATNMQKLLPIFVADLHQGMLAVAGIQWM